MVVICSMDVLVKDGKISNEARNAIETLGGECPEREYDDDPEYEALRGLDQT